MSRASGIEVRATAPGDAAPVRDIYAHEVETGTATFELVAPSVAEMAARRERIVRDGFCHLVAVVDSAVVGFAYVSHYRQRPGYRFTVEDSVYVKPGFRRCGVASALLGALLDDCRDKPFHQMVAVIGDSANSASVRLHRRHGFVEVGVLERVGYKFGRWIDTVIMQRAL